MVARDAILTPKLIETGHVRVRQISIGHGVRMSIENMIRAVSYDRPAFYYFSLYQVDREVFSQTHFRAGVSFVLKE